MACELQIENYSVSEENRKKVLALKNFGESLPSFEEWALLELISRFLNKGQLHPIYQVILDGLLKMYDIEYTQWCYRTPWVRQMIACRHDSDKKTQYFDFYEQMDEKRRNLSGSTLNLKLWPYKTVSMETGKWK